LSVVDLFCGGGGLSEGFRRAGFEVVLGIDKEPKMLAAYRANHPGTEVWARDVLDIDPEELPDADVIVGSPPCQPFSTANTQKTPESVGKGMELIEWMLEVVRVKRPLFWIMENVPPVMKLISRQDFPVRRVLNSADYGVPQTRRRLFAGDYLVPKPTHARISSSTLTGASLKPWVTVRDALGELPLRFITHSAHRNSNMIAGRNRTLDSPSFTIEASPDLVFSDKPLAIGKNADRIAALADPNNMNPDSRGPFSIDEPSRRNIISKMRLEIGEYVTQHHDDRNLIYRKLTVREGARLQSFPDAYIFSGSLTWQNRQVGEAVPPLMAWHLVNEMRPTFGLSKLEPSNDFLAWVGVDILDNKVLETSE